MNTVKSINPASGKLVGETPVTSKTELAAVVSKARFASKSWENTSFSDRSEYAFKLKDLLTKHKEEIAQLTTSEVGKPITEAREDVDFEIDFIDYYAKNAEKILGEKTIGEDNRAIYKTVYEPWGVVVSIAPWNFPVSMASSGITAQLMAGNTVIFKPSEYTTLTQKMFVELFNLTGLPDGVLQCVVGAGDVGSALIDCDINFVWFTGSTKVGQEIYKKCAGKFIKCSLELGGSSPAVVFSDCNFKAAVETVFSARFFNCGQVCSAVKRLFIEKNIYKQFIEALIRKMKNIVVGDPMDSKTTMGPLVSKKQLNTLLMQVTDAKHKGAKFLTGGMQITDRQYIKGNFFEPSIVVNITKDMKLYNDEIFGPVLPVIPFEDEQEAIEYANDTQYGLTAEIFTEDNEKAKRVARSIDAGGISVNGDVIYSPLCPIGGFKKSGIGREYGEEGFKELAQLKYICEHK
ncbi:hypothetical protein A2154_00615 [Candidatus Gottesmanbacteria bacterium RBG_16_43_7]|uniref:Aldehyde dehydrogenase n=1 Tax=Candidatus Gottesmanbacteria bacterium RBG_16_43_7 TaxID=1798373 RepID=A0A1F5Z838_9BACT|nr:MAG: hypothetical protein A2154_00615 [Candidatus Gottesmanbacteria bacterium RBG_16_43_7]